jgi:hypothetical protein
MNMMRARDAERQTCPEMIATVPSCLPTRSKSRIPGAYLHLNLEHIKNYNIFPLLDIQYIHVYIYICNVCNVCMYVYIYIVHRFSVYYIPIIM